MSSRRKLLPVALAGLVLSGLLAACTASPGTTSSAAPSTSSTAKNVTLRVVTWTSNPDQLATLNSLANEYMAKNPSVTKVEFQSVQAAQEGTVLTTDLSAGDPPDVAWLAVQNSRQFIDSDVLVDLKGTLENEPGYDFGDLITSLQSKWTKGKSLYGVPMSTSGRGMYYNADLFKEAGVETPDQMIKDGTWDWKHFAQAAAAISKATGEPGFVIQTKDWSELTPLMYAYGASPWNASATKCTMDSSKMISAMSLLHQMIFEDKSTPLPAQGASQNFSSGGAGAVSNYLSIASLLKTAKFGWGIVPNPSGPGGSKQQVGQTSWVAFKKGQHPDLAAKLIAYLTSKSAQANLSPYFASSRSSLLTASTLHQANPSISESELAPLVQATKKNADVAPVSKNGTATTQAINSALDQYFYVQNADVASAMKKVCAQLTPALSEQ